MAYEAVIEMKEDQFAEKTCATLAEAVSFIENNARYGMCPRGWINNKEVTIRYCKVLDSTGGPLCTNEEWHAVFAPEQDRIPAQAWNRPVLTNPATYAAKGEDL